MSSAIVSFLMQVITLIVMSIYFTVVDKIAIPNNAYLPALGFMLIGAVAATLLNEIIVFFIHSSTTFSRLSTIIGAAAGFAVATYMPYGTLSSHAQTLVKLIPSSYEASALRSLLLNQVSKNNLSASIRTQLISYLGIHFKINGYQLSRIDNAYVMLGMIIALTLIIVIISSLADRKRNR